MRSIQVENNIPRLVDFLETQWRELLVAHEAHKQRCLEISEEVAKHSDGCYYGCITYLTTYSEAKLADVVQYLTNEVIKLGERIFAPASGYLNIKAAQLDHALLTQKQMHEGSWAEYSPATLWKEIENRFEGISGIEHAFRDAAKAVFEQLRTKHYGYNDRPSFRQQFDEAFTVRKQYVRCDVRGVFGQGSWDQKTGSGRCASSASHLFEMFAALETVGSAAGIALVEPGTSSRFGNNHLRYGNHIPYGTEIRVSEHLSLVLRKDVVELHLSHRAHAAVHEFVFTHHPEAQPPREEETDDA